jgi:hypothetical protein
MMTERKPPSEKAGDLVRFKLEYADFSSGAAMAQAALQQAKNHPTGLDLESYGVKRVHRKAGDYVIFSFKKLDP